MNNQQVPLIKLQRKTSTKLEMVKKIVAVYAIMKDIKLSDTDITVLSYFIIYGINEKTKKLIIDSKLLNADSIKNTMSKLRSFGLIKKSEFRRKEDYLNDAFNFPLENIIGMMIKIDNS